MRLSLAFLLLLTAQINLFAQSQISGTVQNHQSEAIFYANVVLYNHADSTIAYSEVTDDLGNFALKNISEGEYYLVASMLSYRDFDSGKLVFPVDNLKNFDISLAPDAAILSTVEVVGRRPLLEQKPDRLVVNVENNITSLNSNLLDVMKRVPGMLVVNDKLSMAGQRNLTILINGKTTRYMDMSSLLRDMPGDNIKSIEVIHQPGAEFDADGTGPVINIILKKNALFGTNGSVYAGLGRTFTEKYNAGLNLSHYAGNLNIQGSAGYSQNAWREQLELVRRVPNGTGFDTYSQVNVDPSRPVSVRGGLTMDYDINAQHRIGFNSNYTQSRLTKVATNTTNIDFRSSEQDASVVTSNESTRDWDVFSINPYYSWEIDSSGQKLDFDINLVDYNINSNNELNNASVGVVQPNQRFIQPGITQLLTSSMDYIKPLNANLKLTTGLKYSLSDIDNNLMRFDQDDNGEYLLNTNQSNQYLFTEDIKAAYAKVDFSVGDLQGTAGLRYEDNFSEGYSVTLDSTLTRSIKKFFPSASLSYPIAGPFGTNLSYSYRIQRPNFWTLNPFVYYYDPYTSERGNPNIRPELTHSGKFSLTYNGQPFFNVEYKRSNDAMVEVTEQDDDTGEAARITINLERFENFNTSLFLPLDMMVPSISGYTGVIVNNNQYNSEYLDGQFNQGKWSVTAFIQANFTLPGEINAEVGGWYTSGDQEGIIESSWLYGTSAGISKRFMNDDLKVSFGIEDFLFRFYNGKIRYANMDLDIVSSWVPRTVNMKVSYKFGNQHMKSKKRAGGSARENMNRVKT